METSISIYGVLDGAKRSYYLYKQGEDESNTIHFKIIKSLTSEVEYFSWNLFEDRILMEHEIKLDIKNSLTARSAKDYKKTEKEKMMGVGLLKRENRQKCDKLIANIHDQFVFDINAYPHNTTHILRIMKKSS